MSNNDLWCGRCKSQHHPADCPMDAANGNALDSVVRHCDSCEFQIVNGPEPGEPHGSIYCCKGHWEGLGDENPNEPDPWKFCKDYKSYAERKG